MQYADPTKLRAYFFGNMYLSDKQHGIQAAHVVTKMFAKYGRVHEGDDSVAADLLYDWSDDGVTKILLNGGYQSNLAVVYEALEEMCPSLELPFAKFHEEEASLNGALTSVGVVVPEEIYAMYNDPAWDEFRRYHPCNGADAATVLYHYRDAVAELGHTGHASAYLYFLLKTARLA